MCSLKILQLMTFSLEWRCSFDTDFFNLAIFVSYSGFRKGAFNPFLYANKEKKGDTFLYKNIAIKTFFQGSNLKWKLYFAGLHVCHSSTPSGESASRRYCQWGLGQTCVGLVKSSTTLFRAATCRSCFRWRGWPSWTPIQPTCGTRRRRRNFTTKWRIGQRWKTFFFLRI